MHPRRPKKKNSQYFAHLLLSNFFFITVNHSDKLFFFCFAEFLKHFLYNPLALAFHIAGGRSHWPLHAQAKAHCIWYVCYNFYTATWLAPILVVEMLIVISLTFYRKFPMKNRPEDSHENSNSINRNARKRDENAARLLRFNEFLFSQRWRRLQNIYSTLISYVYRSTDSVETYKQQHSPKKYIQVTQQHRRGPKQIKDNRVRPSVCPSAGTFVRPSVRASTGGYQLFA